MSPELEELLQNPFLLRQTLLKVLSPDAVDYFMELAVRAEAHRNYLKLVEED